MKKNRLYAAMAAVVLLGAGCSDDIEKNGVGPDPEENGDGVYVAVNIATASKGTLTKAGSSNGEGDVFLDELQNEDKVHDLNIFLVDLGAMSTTNKPLDGLNLAANGTKPIVGHGYTENIKQTPSGGNEPNHDKVTVNVTLTDGAVSAEPKTYQVFAVVNAGSKMTGISTLADLRDYKYTSGVWTAGESGGLASYDKFVMSTHQMTGKVEGNSEVTISTANTESDPAQTTVYVERLAARIDMAVADDLKGNAGLAPDSKYASNTNKGAFKLNQFTVVNQWKGESYLFKQVSPAVTSWDPSTTIPTTYSNGEYKYLGDEIWQVTNATTNEGKYNYVLDPKFSEKTGTDWLSASYTNQFVETNTSLNALTGWTTVTDAFKEGNLTYEDGNRSFYPIAYTKENTTNVKNQKNGYTTGVIFESEFIPGESFTASKYANGSVTATNDNLAKDKTFYVANHYNSTTKLTEKVVYADVKTIAAMAFDAQIGNGAGALGDNYKGFMDGWDNVTTAPTLEAVKGFINAMKESNEVEAAFKTYLQGVVSAENATFDGIKANLTYDEFIKSKDYKNLASGKIDAAYIGTLYKEYGVSCYQGGKSYYKFWIRHDDNNNLNIMGVMEFAIVRNNVYQLYVSGVRDLGDPLPFTPGKDDPGNPNENDEINISVALYVKNWVKRTNADIIL